MDWVHWNRCLAMDWVHWNSWVDSNRMNWHRVHWNGVDGCRVNWGWLVGWGWVSHTVVLDIGHVTTIALYVSMVVNNLDAAVRQGHPVVARYQLGVRVLVLLKVGARVVVVDAVLEGIGLGWFCVAVDWLVHHWDRMDWKRVDRSRVDGKDWSG